MPSIIGVLDANRRSHSRPARQLQEGTAHTAFRCSTLAVTNAARRIRIDRMGVWRLLREQRMLGQRIAPRACMLDVDRGFSKEHPVLVDDPKKAGLVSTGVVASGTHLLLTKWPVEAVQARLPRLQYKWAEAKYERACITQRASRSTIFTPMNSTPKTEIKRTAIACAWGTSLLGMRCEADG